MIEGSSALVAGITLGVLEDFLMRSESRRFEAEH
jgi:hypothetical protein